MVKQNNKRRDMKADRMFEYKRHGMSTMVALLNGESIKFHTTEFGDIKDKEVQEKFLEEAEKAVLIKAEIED